jgi:O-antigen ligase
MVQDFKKYLSLENLIRGSIFISLVALPWYTVLCNAMLITTCVLSIIYGVSKKTWSFNVGTLPLLFFAICTLSLIYTANMKTAVHMLELHASLFFIPVIFLFSAGLITTEFKRILFVSFAISVLLLCIVTYVIVAYNSNTFGPSSGPFNYNDPFGRILFSEQAGIHPSYWSMYLIFSMVIVFQKLKVKDYIKFLIILAMFPFMLILSAKNQIALFFLVLALIIWNYIHVSVKAKLIIIVVSVTLLIGVGALNEQVRYRFIDEMHQTLGERLILWSAGKEIIMEHPVLGVGLGDTDDEVNKILLRDKNDKLFNYNLHNQYLDYWVTYGTVGLLMFLFILLFPLRHPDVLFRIFILIVGVSLLTEAMLLRQKGLVFFLLFYGLCGAGYSLTKKSTENTSLIQNNP